MKYDIYRRNFLKSAAASALAFIPGLSSMEPVRFGSVNSGSIKKRLIFVFSPNGMVRDGFWPKTEGADFEMDGVLKPLQDLREHTLVVHGICNKVRGDGDSHMRGMSCLLTANELFPGNIQGGSDSPAGWAKGISIDQEIKNHLQKSPDTKTRFGSLEYGVRVPNDANPWTRMVYAGPNQPIAPVSDPYRMFAKMYGKIDDRETLMEVLDLVKNDIQASGKSIDSRDRYLLESHGKFVEQMRQDMKSTGDVKLATPPVKLPTNVANKNDNMPELARMQMDLMVNGFQNDLNRIATLQFTRSVGNAKMRWLDVSEGHHGLSHEPDENKDAQAKLARINTWYCEQIAYLANKLNGIKEPGTNQTMLDNTLIIWSNELGHGNSHSLNNLPMVMVGGGFGFEMGRFAKVDNVSTERLWLAVAHAMGHKIERFGLPELHENGPIEL